jgi:hypothetical protein
MCKGDIYKDLLEKNAEDTKSGADQYLLIKQQKNCNMERKQFLEAKKKRAMEAGRRIFEPEEAKLRIEEETKIIELYIDNAKTYIQLASGGLLLSITFMEKMVIGSDNLLHPDGFMIISWVFWLFTVLSGVLYQYAAIKHLEIMKDDHDFLFYDRSWHTIIPRYIYYNPYKIYGVMMYCFYLGIILFTVSALAQVL